MGYNKSMGTYQKILNFIKYNNAFTIIFVVVFFGFGISFAASPAVRDSVYSSEETVISVDNNLIVSTDLDNFNFNLRINSVTEDEKNYYAVYSYQTLAIEDGIWQSKQIEKILTVSKEVLDGKDLGLYVAKELGENINYELSYLKRVQKLEKEKGESQKVVAVAYSGLVGKFLSPKEKVIEGYSPVIPEPVPEVPATIESNPAAVIVSIPPPKSQTNPAAEPQPEAGPPPAETPPPMVNEQLVHDVVEELLQDEATTSQPEAGPPASTSESETGPPAETPPAEPTPETIPGPAVEATSTPEVIPESVSVPEPAPASAPESTP